jgi:hypothetical protein
MGTLTCSGDAGDFLVSLSLAKQLGIDHVNIVNHASLRSSFTDRAHLVIPLAESQPFIKSVTVYGKVHSRNVDVSNMRRFHQRDKTLLEMQRKEVIFQTGEHVKYDSSPWLTSDKSSYSPGRIVIARSPRYNNPRFPWKEIRSHFNDRLLFLGLRDEHKAFEREFGMVEHYQSKDLLEAAQIINGGDLFIGNQSSPNAITQGLGKSSILEVSEHSVDCIYKRDNVTYFTDKPIVIDGREFQPLPIRTSPETKMLWLRAFNNAGIYNH